MQNENYRAILYFICVVISVTLSIQVYWNYKNYKDGKKQLIREVQSSVDSAIDSYFIKLSEENTIGISLTKDGEIIENSEFKSLKQRIDKSSTNKGDNILDRINPSEISRMDIITDSQSIDQDTIFGPLNTSERNYDHKILFPDNSFSEAKDVASLTERIILSFKTDTLEIPVLNTFINEQLSAKNINVDYAYIFESNSGIVQRFNTSRLENNALSTTAKAAYLPEDSHFQLIFTNLTTTIFKRNLIGIVLSTILVACVVACLFFLLKIIHRQKQLAELKNDLIGNITHEFKTPIATAKVALEGIERFNQDNDPVKTKNYLDASNAQLDKLELMVEKLLETATIDGGNLQLKEEKVPLVMMLLDLIEKHRNLAPTKQFIFSKEENEALVIADSFHLENALNNILDNAVKYGGNKIEVSISSINEAVKIRISDNGDKLTKYQAEQLFEKFYRVPKGNTHNVKGFGIGLFYSKNVIEKLGGSIELLLNNQTNFIITIPLNG